MLDIFDILGPIMIGPSSSHTAGAVRIGRMARTLLGEKPVKADIGLYGSFAETGKGHGPRAGGGPFGNAARRSSHPGELHRGGGGRADLYDSPC